MGKAMTGKKERPVRVVQFGEGNFLRAFVDYMIDIANEQGKFDGDIVLVKPIEFGSLEHFHSLRACGSWCPTPPRRASCSMGRTGSRGSRPGLFRGS